MEYYLLKSPLNTKKNNHNGRDGEYHTEPRVSCGTGQSLPLRFPPPLSNAVQIRHDECGQGNDVRDMLDSQKWLTCRLRFDMEAFRREPGEASGERRMRTEADDEPDTKPPLRFRVRMELIILFDSSLAA